MFLLRQLKFMAFILSHFPYRSVCRSDVC